MPRTRLRTRSELSGAFRGPLPFSRGDGGVFFGRNQEIATLAERLTNPRFRLAILEGPPGVGKTSLLLAGLSHHFSKAGEAPLLLYVDASRGLVNGLGEAVDELTSQPDSDKDILGKLAGVDKALERRIILVLDHLGVILATADTEWEEDRKLLSLICQRAVGGSLPGLLLVAERDQLALLAGLLGHHKIGMAPGMLIRLEPMTRETVCSLVERATLASGRYLEAGMPGLIAEDLGVRPILPMDLQLVLAGVFETNRQTSKRYLRAGGAAHVMSDWVDMTCARAGEAPARLVLSALADDAEMQAGWVSASRLTALTGLPSEDTAPLLERLAQAGLVTLWRDKCRLASRALVRHVRSIDGHLRHSRRRAQRILEHRGSGKLPLLPHELFLTARHATTQAHRALIKKSAWIWGGAVACLLVVILGTLLAIQAVVVRRRSLDVSPKGRPDATVVVRKGGGALAGVALFPTTPALGSILVDTAIPASSLARPLAHPTLVSKASGSGYPGWFYALMGRLTKSRALELQALDAPDKADSWTKLCGGTKNGLPTKRLLDLISLAGIGSHEEVHLVHKALTAGGSLAKSAAHAAFSIMARTGKVPPGLDPALLAKAPLPREELERSLEKQPLCQAIRAAILLGRPTRRLLLSAKAATSCRKGLLELAALATGARDPVLAARGFQLLAKAQAKDLVGLALRLLAVLPRVPRPGRVARRVFLLQPTLAGKKVAPTVLATLHSLVRTSKDQASVTAAAGVLTLLGQDSEQIVAKLASSGSADDAVRAGQACLGMRTVKPGPMPSAVVALLQHKDAKVVLAALACASKSQAPPPGPLLRMVTGRSDETKAAAMTAFAQTKLSVPDPYKVARFLYLNGKSGPAGLAGAAAVAAARLVRKPSHWDVAKFFVLPVTHASQPADRAKTAAALLSLMDINPQTSLKFLGRLASDRSEMVRLAVIRAVENLAPKKRALHAQALTKILGHLATDSSPDVSRAAIDALLDPMLGPWADNVLTAFAYRILEAGGRPAAMVALLWPRQAKPAQAQAQPMVEALAHALAKTPLAQDASTILDRAWTLHSPQAQAVVSRAAGRPATAAHAVHLSCNAPKLVVTAAKAAFSISAAEARREALQCLADTSHEWNDDSLQKALWSALPSATDRGLILSALATCASCHKKVGAMVARLARSASTSDRLAAAAAAARLGPKAKHFIMALLDDPSLEVRKSATLGLAKLWSRSKSPESIGAILEHSAAHRGRRHAAALALCLHNDRKTAQSSLDSAASSASPMARLLAKAALATKCSVDRSGNPTLAKLIDLLFLY